MPKRQILSSADYRPTGVRYGKAGSNQVAEGGGILSLCVAVVVWPKTLASLVYQYGARQVFTNQADITGAKRREVFVESHEG